MKNGKLATVSYLAALLLLGITGCNSPTSSHPLMLAPTQQDWNAAFSRLDPDDQELLKNNAMTFAVPAAAPAGAIFQPRYGPPGGKPFGWERLDIPAIGDGFTRAFGRASAKRWDIVDALSFSQISTPGGIQTTSFDFHWTFRDPNGKSVELSEEGFGPGIDIKWFPPETAIDAEANQAVAFTFLRLAIDLEHQFGMASTADSSPVYSPNVPWIVIASHDEGQVKAAILEQTSKEHFQLDSDTNGHLVVSRPLSMLKVFLQTESIRGKSGREIEDFQIVPKGDGIRVYVNRIQQMALPNGGFNQDPILDKDAYTNLANLLATVKRLVEEN